MWNILGSLSCEAVVFSGDQNFFFSWGDLHEDRVDVIVMAISGRKQNSPAMSRTHFAVPPQRLPHS